MAPSCRAQCAFIDTSGTHQATLRGWFDFREVPQLDGIIRPRHRQSERADFVNASQFNWRMKSLQIGASLQQVRDIFGLPLAHVSAAVFEVKPGAQMREFGLDVSFGVESASEYLVYRHPVRRRVLVLCGFRDGLFCGSAQQTFTGDAEDFMLRQIQDWRKQSLSPLSDDTILLA